jgi:DNA ligase-associated metallophosphoesterase
MALTRELRIELAGTEVLLLADKALYWPQQQMLCVADVHFGKAAAYRALGQPVPRGTTSANLSRLDALLIAYTVRQLVFLGDFLHAKPSHALQTMLALRAWRARHAALHCALIRGNHDRQAGDPPQLELEVVNEPMLVGPFILRHTPAAHEGHHVLAGHTHPVFRLNGKGRQSLRLPCFHSSRAITVLPSFGDFTGGYEVDYTPGSRVYVTDGTGVWSV